MRLDGCRAFRNYYFAGALRQKLELKVRSVPTSRFAAHGDRVYSRLGLPLMVRSVLPSRFAAHGEECTHVSNHERLKSSQVSTKYNSANRVFMVRDAKTLLTTNGKVVKYAMCKLTAHPELLFLSKGTTNGNVIIANSILIQHLV